MAQKDASFEWGPEQERVLQQVEAGLPLADEVHTSVELETFMKKLHEVCVKPQYENYVDTYRVWSRSIPSA